jgi:hypothetical protein
MELPNMVATITRLIQSMEYVVWLMHFHDEHEQRTWLGRYALFELEDRIETTIELNNTVIGLIRLERIWRPPTQKSTILTYLAKRISTGGRQERWLEYLFCPYNFAEMECEDPRDREYALHSLLEGYATFNPGYSLTEEKAYIRVAKAIIKEGFLATILNGACYQRQRYPDRFGSKTRPRLPSWVPDFSWILTQSDKQFGRDEVEIAFSTGDVVLQVDVLLVDMRLERLRRGLSLRRNKGNVLCLIGNHQRACSLYELEQVPRSKTTYNLVCKYEVPIYEGLHGRTALVERLFGADPTYERISLI